VAGLGIVLWTCLSCRPSQTKAPRGPALPAIPSIVRFRPPTDGLLTVAQVDRYARVRRTARGRTDEDAARAAGVDPEEVAWVRTRVVEAIIYLETAQVRSAAEGTYARTIASLREAAKNPKDRDTLRRLEQQIALLEKERAGLKAADPAPAAVVANARLVAPRRAELETGKRP
jgi:hypothetical protein